MKRFDVDLDMKPGALTDSSHYCEPASRVWRAFMVFAGDLRQRRPLLSMTMKAYRAIRVAETEEEA